MNFEYQKKFSLEKRIYEANRIRDKYSERVPVIIEIAPSEKNLEKIDKNKYLIPNDLTIDQFKLVVRKRINLTPSQALFLFFINEKNSAILASGNAQMITLYNEYKSEDGFLYLQYSAENTFG